MQLASQLTMIVTFLFILLADMGLVSHKLDVCFRLVIQTRSVLAQNP